MPTTNPVPSQDPSDLLFNAGKLDEVLNGTGTSFTDRLGTARRTVAGMNADFDAQLADAESDLNVYRDDAAASAAQALGYLNTIRTTSYGAYATDPATDPLGNPPTVGDEYFNTTANLLKRWNGTTWQASDINTANMAASSGSSLVGYDTGTVQDVLDDAKPMQSYTALRAYTGRATGVRITTPGIFGLFQRLEVADPEYSAADDGGIIIVDAAGRRWKRLFSGAANIMWWGAKGDYNPATGTGTDDTAAAQAAMVATRVQGGRSIKLWWGKGKYKITAGLIVGSQQYVEFDPGAEIYLIPAADLELTSLFGASNQKDVLFIGNGATIIGKKEGAVIEGRAAGFYLYGTENILLRNFNIKDMATDGITVTGDATGSGPCINVTIQDVNVTGCRRNGMSIISAIGMRVWGGIYEKSIGAPSGPWAGIDIEPNEDCFLEDITLIGVITSENAGSGIQVTPGALSVPNGKRFHVNIIGGRSIRDGGVNAGAGLWLTNGGVQDNKVYGEVNVNGFTVESPMGRGVDVRNWDADKCPRVMLENMTVYNPDSTSVAASNLQRTAYVINADSTQATANIGNIFLRNCHAEDTRATARMTWGFYLGADAGKSLKNIRIEDPTAFNYSASLKSEINFGAASTANGSVDVDVVYSSAQPVIIPGSGAISITLGKRMSVTTSGSSLTLPHAANCIGSHYEFQTASGVNSVSIVPAAGDTIEWSSGDAGESIILDDSAVLSIRSISATKWRVERLTGKSRRPGTAAACRISWATAAPTSGLWNRGDKAFNALPAVGSPKGWVCTVSGTPGTWVSEGNL